MFPYKDENPTERPAVVTVAIIATFTAIVDRVVVQLVTLII